MPDILQNSIISFLQLILLALIIFKYHFFYPLIPVDFLKSVNVLEGGEKLEIVTNGQLHLILTKQELLAQLSHYLIVVDVLWHHIADLSLLLFGAAGFPEQRSHARVLIEQKRLGCHTRLSLHRFVVHLRKFILFQLDIVNHSRNADA